MANGNGIEIEIEILVFCFTFLFFCFCIRCGASFTLCLLSALYACICIYGFIYVYIYYIVCCQNLNEFRSLTLGRCIFMISHIWEALSCHHELFANVLLFIVWLLDELLLKMFYGPCAKFLFRHTHADIHQSSMAVAAFQMKCAFNTFHGFSPRFPCSPALSLSLCMNLFFLAHKIFTNCLEIVQHEIYFNCCASCGHQPVEPSFITRRRASAQNGGTNVSSVTFELCIITLNFSRSSRWHLYGRGGRSVGGRWAVESGRSVEVTGREFHTIY